MLKLIEAVFGSLIKEFKLLSLSILLVSSVLWSHVAADISKLAVSEGLIFSLRSLDLIECTNKAVPEIIREITKIDDKDSHKMDTCLDGQHFKRSMIGLALSFGSGDNLQYNKVKCPRLIASFLRDRILGYSCPYLSKLSELFNFAENKELKTKDSIGKRSIRVHPGNAKNGKLPTILTSLYTRLIQSCDKIEECLQDLEMASDDSHAKHEGAGSDNYSLGIDPYGIKQKVRQSNIHSMISFLPKKIGRRDILTYSNNLLKRATLEFETNFEKESPLDPFWLVQAYRMLLLYSVMLNSVGIFVNLSSYYFQMVFNYLLDTQYLSSIDSLQLQTKYLNLDKSSRKQLLFLRASYTILESCIDFWEDLHAHYVSSILTSKYKMDHLGPRLDFSKICQQGFQLPLRQTLIFFYYAGIKEVIKYSDATDRSGGNSTKANQHESSEFTESTEHCSLDSNEWYDDSCIDFTIDTPWFVEGTSLFYPATTVEELDEIYVREVSTLIKQSDPNFNPKATVLNLDRESLSGYFIGGTGSMMYKSCTYYLKRKLKTGSRQILLAQVTKMSKNNAFHEVSPTEKIRYFCWYTAKVAYPNDSTFEIDHGYETSKFSKGNFKVSQSLEDDQTAQDVAARPSARYVNASTPSHLGGGRNTPTSSSPKMLEYQDIEGLEPSTEKSSSVFAPGFLMSGSDSPASSRRHSSLLSKRRIEILKRLYPQSTDLDIKSLAYSISDRSNDLRGIPVIKKHSNSPSQMIDTSSKVSNIRGKYEQGSQKKDKEDCKVNKGLIPKLLEEIRSGVKLKPTGSTASSEIMENVRREITSSSKNINLGVSSSQIKNDLDSTEFAPPIVETNLLDEMSSNNKFLFDQ
ncbi:putative signal peptide protein [Cryptosporidium canis]|uniref:Signal peptide protein n=1 Tax=Cryptosporidium canis TaxID=195482 RepID=A0ABQ8PBP4_9CRYT|nr:putative signal peptide protein [Cryptosporidium canis]